MTKKNSYSYSRDFAKREKNYESILKTGEAMLAEDKVDNVDILHELLDKLKTRWQSLTHTSHTKHERLTHAYTLANEFKNGCMNCVNNLADLEDELKQQVGILNLHPPDLHSTDMSATWSQPVYQHSTVQCTTYLLLPPNLGE